MSAFAVAGTSSGLLGKVNELERTVPEVRTVVRTARPLRTDSNRTDGANSSAADSGTAAESSAGAGATGNRATGSTASSTPAATVTPFSLVPVPAPPPVAAKQNRTMASSRGAATCSRSSASSAPSATP